MSDLIDQANDCAERDRELAIKVARSAPQLAATGSCLYCDSPIEGERRFCDADCMADFERQQRIRSRQGAR